MQDETEMTRDNAVLTYLRYCPSKLLEILQNSKASYIQDSSYLTKCCRRMRNKVT
jgi:hypothetical protein